MTMIEAQRLRLKGADGLWLVGDARGNPRAPSVLLLHGGGQTRHSWGGTAELLASRGRYTLALDMRGHGESDWSRERRYTVADFAADMFAVIETLEQPPVVVGASLGGMAALLGIGEAIAPRVSGIVLVDISPSIDKDGAERIKNWMLSRPDGFASLEEVADSVAEYTRNRSRERNLKGLEKNVRLGADGRYRWHWDPGFMSGGGGPSEVSDQARLLRAAQRLALPSLLVRGQQSDVINLENAREFLAAAPGAEFVDVAGAGHMVAGDRNDAFGAAVCDFLERRIPL
jgi:pimeloyl-ACP methyl ester carboxylesterase